MLAYQPPITVIACRVATQEKHFLNGMALVGVDLNRNGSVVVKVWLYDLCNA